MAYIKNVTIDNDIQSPAVINNDSIYIADIDIENSDNGDFTGSITDYFDSLKSINTNTTSDNPKRIKLWFERTVYAHEIGLGCDNIAKSFGSDITVKLLGSGEAIRYIENFSGLDGNSDLLEFGPKAFNGIILEFNTASEVCLSNITIRKSVQIDATIQGTTPTGGVTEVSVTQDGYLSTNDNSSGLAIAEGNVTGKCFIHKFGQAPEFDIADGFVTIWDGANDSLYSGSPPMNYIFSTTADINEIASSDNSDTQDIEIQGLDEDYNVVTQTKTLAGQTAVTLDTSLIRVFRMKNVGSTDLTGDVTLATSAATWSGGRPTVANTVRAMIQSDNNQTLMAVYTVPAGKTAYMRDWYAAGSNATGGFFGTDGSATIKLKARPFGQVFQLKHISSIKSNGSTAYQHKYEEPEVFTEKTDIILEANTSVDGSAIAGGFDIVCADN
jgi:uncharacterized protein YdeI (BOF family)